MGKVLNKDPGSSGPVFGVRFGILSAGAKVAIVEGKPTGNIRLKNNAGEFDLVLR
jgi:hypothetical protein